ncbi:hypothetical protein HKCCE2091_10720 [Rhodobacterales bacterium HKCCE2091]|nr:hypothetical protein [Rhodobacterales bacterium HKCCE2091]
MDVSLHFGAHRTATTTLQRMLGQSGRSLRDAGLAYWGPRRTRSDLFHGLIGAGGSAADALPWARRRFARPAGRVGLALSRLEAEGVTRLVVSEENMLGSMRAVLAAERLYPDAGARADRLAGAFADRCRRVGIAIRCYDAWWASALAFSLLRGGPVPEPALLARLVRQPRTWRAVITDLARAFPDADVLVWSHEAMAARPEAVAAALYARDLPRLSGTRDWHNAAPMAADMRRALADLGADTGLVRDRIGRFAPFDGPARRHMQAQYAADIAWLKTDAPGNIRYIDDLGTNPIADGRGKGTTHDGEARRMA